MLLHDSTERSGRKGETAIKVFLACLGSSDQRLFIHALIRHSNEFLIKPFFHVTFVQEVTEIGVNR